MEIAILARGLAELTSQRKQGRRLAPTAGGNRTALLRVRGGSGRGALHGVILRGVSAMLQARALCTVCVPSWNRKTRAVLSKIKFKRRLRVYASKRPTNNGAQSAGCFRPTTPPGPITRGLDVHSHGQVVLERIRR